MSEPWTYAYKYKKYPTGMKRCPNKFCLGDGYILAQGDIIRCITCAGKGLVPNV